MNELMFSFCGFETCKNETDIFPFSAVLNSLQEVVYSCICFLFMKCSHYQLYKFLYQRKSNQQILLRLVIKPV